MIKTDPGKAGTLPMTDYCIHPDIVRAYDIRGDVGETLSDDDAYYLGRAFSTRLSQAGGQRIAIAHDNRPTSPGLTKALIAGVRESGIHVDFLELQPSPLLYYACHSLPVDGGIVVTASHNPKHMNGFKFLQGVKPFCGADLKDMAASVRFGSFSAGAGYLTKRDVVESYLSELLATGAGNGNLRVAWDCGNGATGPIVRSLTKRMTGRHDVLNDDIDDHSRAPLDPSQPDCLSTVRRHVLQHDLDIGIAFDADGDRIGVVGSAGEILSADQLLGLFAEDVLRSLPGSAIVADVKCSQGLFDAIGRQGGVPDISPTGRPLIQARMEQTGSPLGGEMSGHIFFADQWYGFDDALYAAMRLLALFAQDPEIIQRAEQRFAKFVGTPEIRMPCQDNLKTPIVANVKQRLFREGQPFLDVDGIRVTTRDGWWLLRASNTEPALVWRCEAATSKGLSGLKQIVQNYISNAALSCLHG